MLDERERLIQEVAAELGEDPADVRDVLDAIDCCADEEAIEQELEAQYAEACEMEEDQRRMRWGCVDGR